MGSDSVILLDMDGVLVDAVQGAIDYWNDGYKLSIPTTYDQWAPCYWDMPTSVWANMPETPWAQPLLELLARDDCYVCTTPHSNYDGKIEWLAKHGVKEDKVIFTHKKKLLSSRGSILIDDNDENCRSFISGEGYAYCPKQPWNNGQSIESIIRVLEQL